uniref:MYND-type domain-containing protein n=1 Tax=Panagrolaimus sp. ES5 TaxID=591445 RepID=A0AC34G0E5_9BILA
MVYKKKIESAQLVINAQVSPMELLSTRSLEQLTSDFQRKTAFIQYRATLIENADTFALQSLILDIVEVPLHTPLPPSIVSLKKITLKDMDQSQDKVYNAIYNWLSNSNGNRQEQIREAVKTFRPNVLISVINPYIRQGIHENSLIRVESPTYITIDNNSAENKCSCCGKEAELKACSKCFLAKYCSKACQKCDWHEFNHKDVCKYLRKFAI